MSNSEDDKGKIIILAVIMFLPLIMFESWLFQMVWNHFVIPASPLAWQPVFFTQLILGLIGTTLKLLAGLINSD